MKTEHASAELVGRMYALIGCLLDSLAAVGHGGEHQDCQACLDYESGVKIQDECDVQLGYSVNS